MYTKWTSHLSNAEEKQNFERSIRSSRPVLDRIKDIIVDESKGLERAEMDIKIFDQPNWENRQAYMNGYRAALHNLNKLVDLDQQRDTK